MGSMVSMASSMSLGSSTGSPIRPLIMLIFATNVSFVSAHTGWWTTVSSCHPRYFPNVLPFGISVTPHYCLRPPFGEQSSIFVV